MCHSTWVRSGAMDLLGRHRLRSARIVFMILATVGAVAAPSTLAYADPDPAAVEAQIESAWNDLEPTIEQYDKVHGELQANLARAADLERKLQPLQQQLDTVSAKVSGMAVNAYKGGPV